jgi:hypothetical protein
MDQTTIVKPPSHGLTGTHRVRVIRPVLKEAARLCPRVGDYFDLRAQALKLRHWPEHQLKQPNGHVLDLDWCWIQSLPGLNVGEVRVHDAIAGRRNLRVIFFVGDPTVKVPLPLIWIIALLDKKRQEFTKENISIFRSRRTLVVERFYKRREFE